MPAWMLRSVSRPSMRPFALLAAIIVALALVDAGQGRFLNRSTVFSVLQQFSTIGPVALALGLSMIVREFDLSVAGTLSLAGCVAVIAGATDPMVGIGLAILVGLVAGLTQGGIMVWLGLGSLGVTLGGLLTLVGLAYVLTENQTIGYARSAVTELMNERWGGVLTIRSLVALGLFALAALFMAWTRTGRDIVAVGSDRRAAVVAGVNVGWIIAGVFAVSGMLTALGIVAISLFARFVVKSARLAAAAMPAVR